MKPGLQRPSLREMEGRRMYESPSDQSGEKLEAKVTSVQPDFTVTQTAAISYAGIGLAFGVGAGVVTFIGAWAYCIMTYGFVLGLGLGWFPAAICAGIIGWATMFLWGAALLTILAISGFVLIAMLPGLHSSFVLHIAFGAAAGWLIWRICPPWLRGK
jgi:hypothetical protein